MIFPWQKAFLLILSILSLQCGVDAGNPKTPDEDADIETKRSEELSVELLQGQVEESATAFFDVFQVMKFRHLSTLPASSSGPFLTDPTHVNCHQEGDQILVKSSRESTKKKSFSPRGLVIDVQMVAHETVEAQWKDHDGAVSCPNSESTAEIDSDRLSSFFLNMDFTRDTVIIRKESDKERRANGSSKGTRSVHWQKSEKEDGTVQIRQIVTLHTTMTRIANPRLKPSDTTIHFSTDMQTKDGQPIIAETIFDTSGQWQSHKILSGGLLVEQAVGHSVHSTFQNVEFTAAGGCMPVAGTIIGILKEKENKSKRFYEIKFTSHGGKVRFSDGSEWYLDDYLCGLDESRPKF